MKKVLSLFSGAGGMDIGFEGDFKTLECSVNGKMHPDWIQSDDGHYINVIPTGFETVFAIDIMPDAKSAWMNYFSNRKKMRMTSIISAASLIMSRQPVMESQYFPIT